MSFLFWIIVGFKKLRKVIGNLPPRTILILVLILITGLSLLLSKCSTDRADRIAEDLKNSQAGERIAKNNLAIERTATKVNEQTIANQKQRIETDNAKSTTIIERVEREASKPDAAKTIDPVTKRYLDELREQKARDEKRTNRTAR